MQIAGIVNPVYVVSDGRQAISYLGGIDAYTDRTRFPLPSLVLLDLKLPLIMGLDVLKWIRAQPELKTVIVLIFTSSKLPPDVSKAYGLGANSYLVKPSSPNKLPEMVRMIRRYWLELNQRPPPPESVTLPEPARQTPALR